MSRSAEDWQKARQQLLNIRDTIHDLLDQLEIIQIEHPDVIEKTQHKLEKKLKNVILPLANELVGAFTVTWAEEETCSRCGEPAVATCQNCHKPACINCQIVYEDFIACRSCTSSIEHREDGLATAICGCCKFLYNTEQFKQCPNSDRHKCECGHWKKHHIYLGGACSPGQPCSCKEYKEA